MDFYCLDRRELQALCKKNKIPANITNVAMANALKALQIVEGLDYFTRPDSDISQQSPEKITIISLEPPHTAPRTSTRRKPGKRDPKSLQLGTQSCRGTTRTGGGGDVEDEKKELLETPSVRSTQKRAPVTSSRGKGESNVKGENTVQRVYGTRRSTRLVEKMAGLSLSERGKTEAVKIDDICKDMVTDLEESSVENPEKSDVFDGVSEKNDMSGTDLNTSLDGNSKRLYDDCSEVISDLRLTELPEKEGNSKDIVEDSGKVKDNEVGVQQATIEEGSDKSSVMDHSWVSDALDNDDHGYKGVDLKKEIDIDHESSEQTIDINHETVEKTAADVNDETLKIGSNDFPLLSNAEDSEGVMFLENNQQDSNVVCSKDYHAIVVSINGSSSETFIPQEVSELAGSVESKLSSFNLGASIHEDHYREIACHNTGANGSVMKVTEEHQTDQDLESHFSNEGVPPCKTSDEADHKDSDVAGTNHNDSEAASDIVLMQNQMEGQNIQNLKPHLVDEEEDADELSIELPHNEVALDNESDSENSLSSKSDTPLALDYADQVSIDVLEFVENEQVFTHECILPLDKSPLILEQSSLCFPTFEGQSMAETSLKTQPSTEMDVKGPMLETATPIPNSEIMAEGQFSTLAADSLPGQTPKQHKVRTVSGFDSNATHLMPMSLRRMIPVPDENKENTDDNGEKPTSKTPNKTPKMALLLDDDKNVANRGGKSLSKTSNTISSITHVLDGNKENIHKGDTKLKSKRERNNYIKLKNKSLRELKKIIREKRANIASNKVVMINSAMQALAVNRLARTEAEKEN